MSEGFLGKKGFHLLIHSIREFRLMGREKKLGFIVVFSLLANMLWAQGSVRGDLNLNSNFYRNDPKLGQFGTNTTHYERQLSSAEGWFYMNYNYSGFDFNVRYDFFHNSNLLNPQEAFSDQGLIFFNASKQVDKLHVTVGSFYDQFGSGILWRAYEDRLIGLDFAMTGLKLEYDLLPNLKLKAFTGRQKYRFDLKPQVVMGINAEGYYNKNDWSFTYGASGIKRTLEQKEDVEPLASIVKTYPREDWFVPKFNVYGAQAYGSIAKGAFALSFDGAMKTNEAIFDYDLVLLDKPGYYGQAELSFGAKGIGINLKAKRSEYFSIRTDPTTALNPIAEGQVSYLPPVNRLNSYRLPARYAPAVQELGELGFSGDMNLKINKSNSLYINLSNVVQPNILDEELFREAYVTLYHKFNRKFKMTFGYQNLLYNQKIYEGKPDGTPNVLTNTGFVEMSLKLPKKRSMRVELHYLSTDQDLGDFAFGLLEFNVSRHFSITVSDMINTDPNPATRNDNVAEGEMVHYPTVFLLYVRNQTRFTAGYVKQVEGVVCTGGVCRVEPAFSGWKFGMTTNF